MSPGKRIVLKLCALTALGVVAKRPAQADELPGTGGWCTGSFMYSDPEETHCCALETCYANPSAGVSAQITWSYFTNPECSESSHGGGSFGECCGA